LLANSGCFVSKCVLWCVVGRAVGQAPGRQGRQNTSQTMKARKQAATRDKRTGGGQPPNTAGGNTTRGETAHRETPPVNMVFCGVLWCFAGILWRFAGVLWCFASVLQYFHKTHKTPEKHRKTLKNTKNSQYARVLRAFKEQKKSTVLNKTPFTKHLQITAKHRKTPQNSHKTRFACEITSQNTAKKTQNAQKVTKQSQYNHNTYCAHSVYSSKIL